jgi:hypothetical protein
MKTISLYFLMTLAASAQLLTTADGLATFKPKAASGGGCSTTYLTYTNISTAATLYMGYSPDFQKGGFTFIPTNSFTVCSADIACYKTGSPNFGVKVSIYSDSSGLPGTLIGSSSYGVSTATFGTTEAVQHFTGMSAAVTSGTQYWVVVEWDGTGTFDLGYANYIQLAYGSGVSTIKARAYNGTIWTGGADYAQGKYNLFGDP